MPLFAYWCTELGLHPGLHRKVWELVFITQTLHEQGKLSPGAKGLGFGVGREPLATYFAKRGIDILATDLDAERAAASGWAESGQHAKASEDLYWPGVSSREVFDRHVRYRNVDMNDIPADLEGFDFCWSACSLEHLGTLQHGLDFIENSLKTLKPGGVAVHTTEFNLTSDTVTLEHGGTVLYRRRDIEKLRYGLEVRGHTVLPVNYYAGATEVDEFVDVPPYGNDLHLRLQIAKYNATSIGLAVIKG